MKLQSFTTIVAASLTAMAVAYVSPALADETATPTNPSMSAPASTNNSDTQNAATSQTDNNMNNSNDPADQGTPDTATGDDDY